MALPTLSPSTSYSWGVIANNTAGQTAATGNYRTFTTAAAPGAFVKTAPANGATAVAMNGSNQVTLTWNAASNAIHYWLRCTTASGSDNFTNIGNVTSYLFTAAHNTTYYWQIIAQSNGGQSGWGAEWTFTTEMESPGAFNKTAPTNNATLQPKTVTLTWGTSTNAQTYYYRYSTTSGGGTWASNGSSTSKVITGLTPKATYYWHVYATNNSGDLTYANSGTQWSFTVIADPRCFW